MTKRLLAVASAALLALAVAAPSFAQDDVEDVPPGATVILVYQYDGVDWIEAGVVPVPPVACDPL